MEPSRDIRERPLAETDITTKPAPTHNVHSVEPPEVVGYRANRQGVGIYWHRGNQDRDHDR